MTRRGSVFQRSDDGRFVAQGPRLLDEHGKPLRDPRTGRRLPPPYLGSFGTEEDGQRALTAYLYRLDEGTLPRGSGTVEAHLASWLERIEVSGDLSPNTLRAYEQHVRDYFNPAFGWRKLTDLRAYHINELYLSLRRDGGG